MGLRRRHHRRLQADQGLPQGRRDAGGDGVVPGAAEASLPLGWQLSGLWRFGEVWISMAEGPEFDDYASGSGLYAEQALRRLSDRLRERRGSASG